MNTKAIIVGFIAIVAVVAGATAVILNQPSDSKDGNNATSELDGYWYTIDGKAFIEGVGVQELNSADCKLPKDLTDIRIDQSYNNVFYGTFADERIAGTYFEDGRIMFEYPTDSSLQKDCIFSAVYDDGLMYVTMVFSYKFDIGEKECAVTSILSKDPDNDSKLKDLPAIKGQWKMYESHLLSFNNEQKLDSCTLTVENEAVNGLFQCKTVSKMGDKNDESQLLGVMSNVSVHGKYLGFLVDIGNNMQVWNIVFDGDDISLQTVVKANPSASGLTSMSCSFSTDGSATEKEYPQFAGQVYYPEDSMLSTILKGVGKIVNSNSSFLLNITKQSGPCFVGTAMIDGSSSIVNGVMDSMGHIILCYVYGNFVDVALGCFNDEKMEIGTYFNTNTLGRSARYLEMEPMPQQKFIEDPDIVGPWVLSSFASFKGVTETIFSPSVHTIPLFISSIENGIVRGTLFEADFVGTYGPTTTGHGSIWAYIPYNGGELSFEIVVTHNDVMFATMTFQRDDECCQVIDMCQVIYTKAVEYSTIPNFRVDIFEKQWETYRIKHWDGDKLTESSSPSSVQLQLERSSDTGIESFFKGKLIFTVPGSVEQKEMSFIGGFYEMGVYGNAIANIYGVNSDCVSLCYFDGLLYIHGSFEAQGNLRSFHIIFKEKGAEAKDPFNNRYYEVEDKTFESDDFSMTYTNQEGFYVYGTISVTYNGETLNGKFIGMQLCVGGPVYIETVIKFDNGNVWDAHVVLIADDDSEVTSISFETVWYDQSGTGQAARVIAKC